MSSMNFGSVGSDEHQRIRNSANTGKLGLRFRFSGRITELGQQAGNRFRIAGAGWPQNDVCCRFHRSKVYGIPIGPAYFGTPHGSCGRRARFSTNRGHNMRYRIPIAAAGCFMLSGCASAANQQADSTPASSMSFFLTSAGSGNGADLGGLAGADKRCQDLAQAAGAGGRTWRAYLSAAASGGSPAVNARDRIGTGPWRNASGVVIATSVADLHSDNNKLNKQTAITETGAIIPGRGDGVNQHDILTGSNADGTLATGTGDMTCNNWTSSATGAAMVGHHDRMGLRDDAPSKSWNASHPSRGCSQANLQSSGGAGLYYCFAN